MKKNRFILIALVALLVFLGEKKVSGDPLWADLGAVDGAFVFFEQFKIYDLKTDPVLNPNQEILAFPEWNNRLYSIVTLNAWGAGGLRAHVQFRPTVTTTSQKTDYSTIVDESYLELSYDQLFVFMGKRNIKNGVALSANPTDFLGETKRVDKSKKEEERRIEREGDYLVGIDFLGDKTTLSIMASPKMDDIQSSARYLVDFSLLLDQINTDASFHYFNAPLSGFGVNVSTTLGDNLVMYSEGAFRYGVANAPRITLIEDGTPRQYERQYERVSGYWDAVFGGHYTAQDNSSITLEYHYNGGGYSQRQWNDTLDFIHYANDQYNAGVAPSLMRGYLQQANGLMDFGKMRKHYVFFRYATPNIWDKTQLSMMNLFNVNDRSDVINAYLEYSFSDNLFFYVSAYYFLGSETSEFGLINWTPEITMSAKFYLL